ncbi:MAG: hypothetical protein ACRC8L_13045, partial [Plesiomonas shigelloides]
MTNDNELAPSVSMSGLEMASILLLSLSEEDAGNILSKLEPKQVQKLGRQMAVTLDPGHDQVS